MNLFEILFLEKFNGGGFLNFLNWPTIENDAEVKEGICYWAGEADANNLVLHEMGAQIHVKNGGNDQAY